MSEAAPKVHTPRDPSRPTLGTLQGAFARIWLGKPLLPWQQRFADVAGELLPSGAPAYPLVICTVQRQAGKSHLEMAQTGERCFSVPGFRAFYTAQTGGDARDQFLKFAEEVVDGAPLDQVVTTLKGNGHEVMKFPNRSRFRPMPPVATAGHGKQADRASIDEAWAFTLAQGDAILQAMSPAKLTRPNAQTFIWSAGGTADSTWLASLVARGREGDPRICFAEYGIPDDADAEDLDVIAAHHPAVGHTITRASLETMRTEITDPAAWARAAGNRWTEVIGGAIPGPTWDAVRFTDPLPADAPTGYGVARAADGSQVAIVAAVQLPGGVIGLEVLDILPTGYKAAEHVLGWARSDTIAVARTGSSAGLADELVRARRGGDGVLALSSSQVGAACSNLLDALPRRGYRFRQHPDLDAAVTVAAVRKLGEGGQAFTVRAGGASIAPLEAASLAAWALTHRTRKLGAPTVRLPGEASPP
jgi:hypothetical protein